MTALCFRRPICFPRELRMAPSACGSRKVLDILSKNSYARFCFIKHVAEHRQAGALTQSSNAPVVALPVTSVPWQRFATERVTLGQPASAVHLGRPAGRPA